LIATLQIILFIENHIADNLCGIELVGASDTIIRKNNFIDNRFHALFYLGYSYKHSNKWQKNFYSPQVPRSIKIIFGVIKTPFSYTVYPPDAPPYERYISRPGFNVDWNPASEPYDIGV
jgi:parallel beta-helix repeat protein